MFYIFFGSKFITNIHLLTFIEFIVFNPMLINIRLNTMFFVDHKNNHAFNLISLWCNIYIHSLPKKKLFRPISMRFNLISLADMIFKTLKIKVTAQNVIKFFIKN